MKRAAIFIIAIATLVLIGYPSAPSLADTSNSIATSKSGPSVTIVSAGGTSIGGATDSGGGSNQGDADGLSGLKGRPPVSSMQSSMTAGVTRVMIALENWWKFVLWNR
ncbi:MAG TPA: hypothetical protein VFX92_06250 [Candidatus Krumholzibacteria bacterium]|nr:hypothetical protein [Candidatus Krumholzibacteria bacterium]